eukprot:COSAG01_NODE_916_length_12760_cov_13.023379_9_plen_99_part_00
MRLLTETPTHHPKNPVNSENPNHPTQRKGCNPGVLSVPQSIVLGASYSRDSVLRHICASWICSISAVLAKSPKSAKQEFGSWDRHTIRAERPAEMFSA